MIFSPINHQPPLLHLIRKETYRGGFRLDITAFVRLCWRGVSTATANICIVTVEVELIVCTIHTLIGRLTSVPMV